MGNLHASRDMSVFVAFAILVRFLQWDQVRFFGLAILFVLLTVLGFRCVGPGAAHHRSNLPAGGSNQSSKGHGVLPRVSVRSHHRGSKTFAAGPIVRLFVWILSFTLGVRIGEASHPGPHTCEDMWSLGTFNPSGLTTKADVVADLPGDFWGITESHLSSLGFEKFKVGLHSRKSHYEYVIQGAPCNLRARSESVGTFSGVLAISPWPTRALDHGLSSEQYATSRIQFVGTCIHQVWIQIAVVYGFPYSSTHQYPKFQTEQLLSDAIDRIACQTSGPRVIMGDFNWLRPELSQLDRLEAMGFREVQDVAHHWWGRKPMPTGKGSRQIDFVYLSPELIPLLRDVRVIDSWWADHSAVVANFGSTPATLEHHRWKMPQPIPWPQFIADVEYPLDLEPSLAYASLWNQIEQQANAALVAQGLPSLATSQLGRGQTLEPTRQRVQKAPIRKGRTGEVQPSFFGPSIRYAQQFKQVRRLQSLKAALKKPRPSPGESIPALWGAIRHSTGFPGGFCFWWKGFAQPKFGGPAELPLQPPNFEEACLIFHGTNEEVKAFGIKLQQERLRHAKQIRQHDLHYVFRDCSQPAPKKVDVLVSTTQAEVQAINHREIHMTTPVAFDVEHPLVCNGQDFHVDRVDSTTIRADQDVEVQPGDVLRQSQVTSDVHLILEAFRDTWAARWQKAHHLLPNQWTDIANFVEQVAPPMQWDFPDWSLDRLVRLAKGKKQRAAVGPDGVTRNDILSIPVQAQAACLSVLRRAEDRAEWPCQLATGIVSLLEKHPLASSVADYRPIVVYPFLV